MIGGSTIGRNPGRRGRRRADRALPALPHRRCVSPRRCGTLLATMRFGLEGRRPEVRAPGACFGVGVRLRLDAGGSRDDTDYVMDTFPIVRKNDEKTHGEYRTKRVIREIWDAASEAARTGKPYQTRLDPPPADPRVAHPPSTRPDWAKKGAS